MPKDFQTVRTVNKGHGRHEERTLTTSSLLNDYLDWPGLAQVFKLERRVQHGHRRGAPRNGLWHHQPDR